MIFSHSPINPVPAPASSKGAVPFGRWRDEKGQADAGVAIAGLGHLGVIGGGPLVIEGGDIGGGLRIHTPPPENHRARLCQLSPHPSSSSLPKIVSAMLAFPRMTPEEEKIVRDAIAAIPALIGLSTAPSSAWAA